MNIEEYRDYCLAYPGVTEAFPFDEKTLVFKVLGKMFALSDIDNFKSINLKCDPERAIALREEFEDIIPGWHMSKVHWNTVHTNGMLDDSFIEELIGHSYQLVADKLTKKDKELLKSLS